MCISIIMEPDIFDQYNEVFEQYNVIDTKEQCCITPNIKSEDGTFVCVSCGIIDLSIKNYIITSYSDESNIKKIQYYKRISYFREKLKLLRCTKMSNSPNYNKLLNLLKNNQFVIDTGLLIKDKSKDYVIQYFIKINFINRIKRIIRRLKYSKLFKYIYVIIFDLYGVYCFHIENRFEYSLCVDFVSIEYKFKKSFPLLNNMISYNVILFYLLKRYNIENYKLIPQPANKLIIESKIQMLNVF
jgi:hypothetical protein